MTIDNYQLIKPYNQKNFLGIYEYICFIADRLMLQEA